MKYKLAVITTMFAIAAAIWFVVNDTAWSQATTPPTVLAPDAAH
jgi:hypothetical protein